jgi:valyl-tRNA synthetase
MNEDGTLNENAGPFRGMDRFDVRQELIRVTLPKRCC